MDEEQQISFVDLDSLNGLNNSIIISITNNNNINNMSRSQSVIRPSGHDSTPSLCFVLEIMRIVVMLMAAEEDAANGSNHVHPKWVYHVIEIRRKLSFMHDDCVVALCSLFSLPSTHSSTIQTSFFPMVRGSVCMCELWHYETTEKTWTLRLLRVLVKCTSTFD